MGDAVADADGEGDLAVAFLFDPIHLIIVFEVPANRTLGDKAQAAVVLVGIGGQGEAVDHRQFEDVGCHPIPIAHDLFDVADPGHGVIDEAAIADGVGLADQNIRPEVERNNDFKRAIAKRLFILAL